MQEAKFLAGFGMANITPEESVPLTSYGDDLNRFSEGKLSELEARALALTDADGKTLLFVVGDLSWAPWYLAPEIHDAIEAEFGIPKEYVILSGHHTHAAPGCHLSQVPSIMRYREKYIQGMTEAARLAMADRKPAQLYVGSAITERMNFVRRYIMDDGSYCGDVGKGTGTVILAHESQADPELQLMKITREGGKDILVSQFQCHPHLEGKKKLISSQLAGNFRAEAEKRLDVHCLYWNGGAGNVNSHSKIERETRTKDPAQWAKIMVDYAQEALPHLHRVKSGPVKVSVLNLNAPVNHSYDGLVEQAKQVKDYRAQGHTIAEAIEYAQQLGINSPFHANRILANAELPETKEIYLRAYSFGDVGGVVLPYELFDTTCMYIKRNSPFRKTFITGYSFPSYCGYIPSKFAFANGGYEADNCTFAPGAAERMAEAYLDLLKQMH